MFIFSRFGSFYTQEMFLSIEMPPLRWLAHMGLPGKAAKRRGRRSTHRRRSVPQTKASLFSRKYLNRLFSPLAERWTSNT
jgi:hypothetical protein